MASHGLHIHRKIPIPIYVYFRIWPTWAAYFNMSTVNCSNYPGKSTYLRKFILGKWCPIRRRETDELLMMSRDGFSNFAHNTTNRRLRNMQQVTSNALKTSSSEKIVNLLTAAAFGGMLDACWKIYLNRRLSCQKYFLLCPSK